MFLLDEVTAEEVNKIGYEKEYFITIVIGGGVLELGAALEPKKTRLAVMALGRSTER